MTKNVLNPHWTGGDRAEPIDPATIRFKVVPGPVYADCEGCMFINQLSPVCKRAAEIAGHDCDDPLPSGHSIIYVADKSDPRQLDLLEQSGQNATAIASAPDQNNLRGIS